MASWTGKSRGNVLGYKMVVGTLRIFGLPATYLLLRVISYYFYLFAGKPKRELLHFYQQHLHLNLREAKLLCRKNFYLLAQNLLDKIALLINKGNQISYTQTGEEELVNWAKEGKGGFLLSAHIGNWAIAGNLLKAQNLKVNVLMVQNEEEKLREYLEAQKGGPQFKTIVIKDDLSHLVEIYKALKAGEFICINADRFVSDNRLLQLDFLGDKAPFPEGPFTLIHKLKAKYSFVFATKQSKYKYQFSATLPKLPSSNPEAIAQEYANEVEKQVKLHPEQWYNYYNFFAQTT